MAKKKAQLRQTLHEKYYYTLQFLESAFMLGSEVDVTPVVEYSLGYKSGERFRYGKSVNTYIIFNERPKVNLLQRLGWYREGQDAPILAYIPTHLLYEKESGSIVNETSLYNRKFKSIIRDEDEEFELRPLRITRGAILDIKYDFVDKPDSKFYVAESKIDTVSLQYIARLVPYKHVEARQDTDDINITHLNFDTDAHGI